MEGGGRNFLQKVSPSPLQSSQPLPSTLLALVDDALGFAFGAGQGIMLYEFDLGRDEDFVLEGAGDGLLKAAQHAHVFHKALLADFE